MEMLKSFGRRSFVKMASLATALTATSAFSSSTNNNGVLRNANE